MTSSTGVERTSGSRSGTSSTSTAGPPSFSESPKDATLTSPPLAREAAAPPGCGDRVSPRSRSRRRMTWPMPARASCSPRSSDARPVVASWSRDVEEPHGLPRDQRDLAAGDEVGAAQHQQRLVEGPAPRVLRETGAGQDEGACPRPRARRCSRGRRPRSPGSPSSRASVTCWSGRAGRGTAPARPAARRQQHRRVLASRRGSRSSASRGRRRDRTRWPREVGTVGSILCTLRKIWSWSSSSARTGPLTGLPSQPPCATVSAVRPRTREITSGTRTGWVSRVRPTSPIAATVAATRTSTLPVTSANAAGHHGRSPVMR